jgi:uncharacterized protein YbbC (DUF1343 family)
MELKSGLIRTVLCFLLMITPLHATSIIEPGANQPKLYLPLLKNKRVGVFVNQTSTVQDQLLVDFLLKNHVNVTRIFTPEHGYDGKISDGEEIADSSDHRTGITIVSLYGKRYKPSAKELTNVDVLVFDIQDVGVRFYTYLASLQRFMEAAIENNKPLIILDRPNPNGFYVDGPVLDKHKHSLTGMQPIPIVYGMTLGEYARMLVGENWLKLKSPKTAKHLRLTIIPVANYTHRDHYVPPIPPSPNLPTIDAIYLYPSIGLIEGEYISVGRGTDKPFQVFGHPEIKTDYSFVPQAKPGAINPPFKNEKCYGWNLSRSTDEILRLVDNKLQIKYYQQVLQALHGGEFTRKKSFKTLSDQQLAAQIRAGMTEDEIRRSWEPALSHFKTIREKYLLYPDFQ